MTLIQNIPVELIAKGFMGKDEFVEGSSIGCSESFLVPTVYPQSEHSIRTGQTKPSGWQRKACSWCKCSPIRFVLHIGRPLIRLCSQGMLDSRQLTQKDLAGFPGRSYCKEVSSEGSINKGSSDSAHSNDHFVKNTLFGKYRYIPGLE